MNNRIRCLDKVRMPGAREKRALLEEFHGGNEVVFSLIGDFEEAPHRFKYQRSEQGYLACKVAEEDQEVYMNKVGTFGIASTPLCGLHTIVWIEDCPSKCCFMRMTWRLWHRANRGGWQRW